ncbi:type II toxin-antitoxin system YhaV family toxin [Bradyrhizobium elkanii]|uniref:type II toxin-antitoxin system YhaV family toxin n=1 Tax=Bradyrhizobium elkanii TaxID=29448 RepID=UPI000429F4DD|nr:type II toxin-antitoxin system YhaV family toxin [Bradyrhizobium elkanii]
MSDDNPKINGWTIYAQPLFLDQLEAMIAAVEKAQNKDLKGYKKKRMAELLAAVLKLAFEDIPSDPLVMSTGRAPRSATNTGTQFLQQFRLFFRYHQSGNCKGYRARLGKR